MPQFIWKENIKHLIILFERPSTTIMGSTYIVQGIVYSVCTSRVKIFRKERYKSISQLQFGRLFETFVNLQKYQFPLSEKLTVCSTMPHLTFIRMD